MTNPFEAAYIRPMRIAALLLAFLLAAPLRAQSGAAPAPTDQQRVRGVVLIAIDGLKPEYVLEASARGLKVPTLRAMVARGAYARGVVGVVPTVTYPSHTTLVTGAAPARHGIVANNTFDPFNRNQGGWYWYASDVRVPTLWDVMTDARRTVGNVHWPVTVGARITWNLPQYWRSGEADDRKLVAALSSPGLYDSLERDLGIPYTDGKDESLEGDERRARFAERMIETRRPALMLAYFTALDHEQHVHGPFSAEAAATLERLDAVIASLTRAARRAYGEDGAVVAVVSDHGFMRTSRALNLIHALRNAGLVTTADDAPDRPTAWRATVWSAGGSAAVVVNDSSAALRDSLGTLLRSLSADTANGIERVVDRAGLARLGGFPSAAYLVNMREGFFVGSNMRGPLVSEVRPGGTHGYLPDSPAMYASFFIVGPTIPRGRDLGVIDQRSIAPTLARLLGVRLPAAEAPALVP
jgi:predicted AlkP superfamily pyrophosphatase or phosphodiesterase